MELKLEEHLPFLYTDGIWRWNTSTFMDTSGKYKSRIDMIMMGGWQVISNVMAYGIKQARR